MFSALALRARRLCESVSRYAAQSDKIPGLVCLIASIAKNISLPGPLVWWGRGRLPQRPQCVSVWTSVWTQEGRGPRLVMSTLPVVY